MKYISVIGLLISGVAFADDGHREALFAGESPELVSVVNSMGRRGSTYQVFILDTKSKKNVEVYRCKGGLCAYSFDPRDARNVLEQAKKDGKKVRLVRETTPRWYWFDKVFHKIEIDDGTIEVDYKPDVTTSREEKKDYRLRGNGYPDCPDSVCGKEKSGK